MLEKHGLCIFVENEFGVIQRLTNLFSARGMSIETIHTTTVNVDQNISQVSISLYESKKNIELVQKLLMRILIVHEVLHIKMEEGVAYFSQIFHTNQGFSQGFLHANLSLFTCEEKPEIHCITGGKEIVDKFCSTNKNFQFVKNFQVF